MFLALVTETYPPEVNGVAMTLQRLVRGLASRGHRLQIIRPRQGKADPADQDGAQHLLVRGIPLPRYQGLRLGLPAAGAIASRWRGDRPDIVHIATEGPLGCSALGVAQRLGIAVSSSFHTNFHQYGKHYGYGMLHRVVSGHLRRLHNRAGVTLVPSLDVREALVADGFQRVAVLARGVDAQLFNPQRRSDDLRRQWGADAATPVVAYVGRIAQEKNLPLAVRAFEALRAHAPAARFVLVGDGPMRATLAGQHRDYHFAGMQRGEDLARHYASADLFLFPSVTETFGNVVTEAMASGLAVVTYAYAAGRQHIQHGVNGMLAPFDDADAYVATACALAQRGPQAWRDMGAVARQAMLGVTWDAIITQFEDQLKQLAFAKPQAAAVQAATR
jgi:glycosyltransferase involved in cell wall biosynthesis